MPTATVQPASVNFWLYQGATFTAPVTLKDSDQNPIDLTGYSGKLMMRRDISDASPIATFQTTDATMVLGGTAGTVTLNMTATLTAGLTIDFAGEVWYHDLLLKHADGVTVDKPYQGVVIAAPGVTR